MKIDTTPVESNNRLSNARTVMSTIYAAMLTLSSAVMIQSSPEAVQAVSAHPVAAAAAIGLAIVGALKFINNSIDAIMEAEGCGFDQAPPEIKCENSCSSSEDIQKEMDRLSKEKSTDVSKGPTSKGL